LPVGGIKIFKHLGNCAKGKYFNGRPYRENAIVLFIVVRNNRRSALLLLFAFYLLLKALIKMRVLKYT